MIENKNINIKNVSIAFLILIGCYFSSVACMNKQMAPRDDNKKWEDFDVSVSFAISESSSIDSRADLSLSKDEAEREEAVLREVTRDVNVRDGGYENRNLSISDRLMALNDVFARTDLSPQAAYDIVESLLKPVPLYRKYRLLMMKKGKLNDEQIHVMQDIVALGWAYDRFFQDE